MRTFATATPTRTTARAPRRHPARRLPDPALTLQRAEIRQILGDPRLQAKLTVGAPNGATPEIDRGLAERLQRRVDFKADFENISLKKGSGATISGSSFRYEDADFSADAKVVATGDTAAELADWDVGILQDLIGHWDRYYYRRSNTDRKGRFVEKKYRPVTTRFRDQLNGSTTVWTADSEHQLLSALAPAAKGARQEVTTTIHTSDVPQGPESTDGSSHPGMDASDGSRNIDIQRTGARFDTWISARNTASGAFRHLRRLNWNYQRSLDFAGIGAALSVDKESWQLGKHGPHGPGKGAPLTSGTTYNSVLNDDTQWFFRRVNGWT